MKDNRFYVYALVDPTTANDKRFAKVFYIGKGTGRRIQHHFWKSKKDRNPHKWNKVQKILRENPDVQRKDLIRYIFTGLTEEKALKLEKDLIREVGLDNLTNIAPGGNRGPSYMGEDHQSSKISRQEAEWIRWLGENSRRTCTENFNKYQKNWSSSLSLRNYMALSDKQAWKHLTSKKPPFFDPHWDDLKYTAVKYYLQNDVSKEEAAQKYGFTKGQMRHWLYENCLTLVTRFEEEYGYNPIEDEKERKQNARYTAVVEYLTTDATQKEAAEKQGFSRGQLKGWLKRDCFGLVSRFENEHNVTTKYSSKQIENDANFANPKLL